MTGLPFNPYETPTTQPVSTGRKPRHVLWFAVATWSGLLIGIFLREGPAGILSMLRPVYVFCTFSAMVLLFASAASLVGYDRRGRYRTARMRLIPRIIGGLVFGISSALMEALMGSAFRALGVAGFEHTLWFLPTHLTAAFVVGLIAELVARRLCRQTDEGMLEDQPS